MLNSKKQSFQPIFFNWYLSNEKTAFVDMSRVEPTICFIEKISFSFKLFSGHFYGQSFIETVQGPLCVAGRFGFRLGPTFCRTVSRSKLFAKDITTSTPR